MSKTIWTDMVKRSHPRVLWPENQLAPAIGLRSKRTVHIAKLTKDDDEEAEARHRQAGGKEVGWPSAENG